MGASMMATTVYLFFRASAVQDKFKSAVLISGLVTFIAAYHYVRIFNSWVEAYEFPKPHFAYNDDGTFANATVADPVMTGVPFNDAYRYMDWLLTVPLLLIEILLVMKLEPEEYTPKSRVLGIGSALMIVSGYYGELYVVGDLTPRWFCWILSMAFFCYIVYELMVGLSNATQKEDNDAVRNKIKTAQLWTVVSWTTYPVVYMIPMWKIKGPDAVVGIQIGYCISDIISKCGVGLIIYGVTDAKAALEKEGALLP